MVIGSHIIFCAYGFWLPNDPRGSWSDFVGSWELARFGRSTKTDTRRSVAAVPHNGRARLAVKGVLKYPPVHFSGIQARAVGRGLGELIAKSQLTVWACSILPEHVHVVLGRHDYPVEQAVTLLKGQATRRLMQENIHPLAAVESRRRRPPTPWARGLWKVFLNSAEDVRRSIRYVEENPIKEGKPLQSWPFVTDYVE